MRALMHFLARLPLPLLHGLGVLLGWAVYGLSPTYRRHLRANLATAGYHDARVRRGAIAEAGKMALEAPKIWLRPLAETALLVRELDGVEHVDAARAAGKGIVFLTPHLGCFEITPQFAGGHFPITALYRAPKIAWVHALVEEARAQHHVRLAPADVPGVRALPSDANFFLLELLQANPKAVFESMARRGVLVRDVTSYPLLSRCLRVSIGSEEENRAVLDALTSFMGANGAAR